MFVGRGHGDRSPSGIRTSTCTGDVWSDLVLDTPQARTVKIFFPPEARTHWHRHPGGQILYTIAGEGWIQERGGDRVLVGPGDVVWTDPGVEHWHGATDTGLVVQLLVHFGDVDWTAPVADDEYRPSN